MKGSLLVIGMRIQFEIIDDFIEHTGQVYVSQIIDILDDHNYIIAAPIHELKIVYSHYNSKLKISFIHEKHERNEIYSFYASVVKNDEKNNIFLTYIKRETGFKRIQRRNFFRLGCNLNLKYKVQNKEDVFNKNADEPEECYKCAVTKNISAGGACIVTKEFLEKDAIIEVVFSLDEGLPITALCKVIRSTKFEDLDIKRTEFGLYIVEITQKDRDQIFKYIFEKERYLLKEKKIRM